MKGLQVPTTRESFWECFTVNIGYFKIPGHPSAHGRGVGRSGGACAPWVVGHASVGAASVRGVWCGMEKATAGGPGRGGWWPQQVGLGATVRSGGPVVGFAVPEADAGCGAPASELPMVMRR
jgi:hypothetical protein